MVIEVTFDVTDVYISTTVSPVYVNVSFEAPSGGGGTWGSITGTLSNQTDLQNALNAKYNNPTGTTSQYLRGDGSLATFPSLTGYVPYTGATGQVDLGNYDLRVQGLTIGKGNNALVNNTALGHSTLLTATTGNFNTAVGYESLRNTTTGQYNTAVGQSSLFSNTTGGQNTALGLNALLSNTTGSSNVAVGLDTLQHITTGSSNTAIGYNAGSHITGGSTPNTTATNSVFIGRDSKANADGQTNQIVIGQNAVGNGSNTATFGNTATTANYFTGSINGGSFVKSGGTSSQFLKADGTVDSSVYVPTSRELTINGVTFDLSANRTFTVGSVTGSGASGQVAYWDGTTSQAGSGNFLWDNTNSRLSVISSGAALRGIAVAEYSNSVAGAIATFEKSRGTFSSPINVNASDLVGVFSFSARVGGVFTSDRALFGANMATSTGMGLFFNAGSSNGVYAPSMYIHPTGNVSINPGGSIISGSITDGGQRLQVQGTTLLNGNVTFSSATGMFWDATNSRLNFGNTLPTNTATQNIVYSTTLVGVSVKNTSSASGSTQCGFYVENNLGHLGQLYKTGGSYTTYKTISANDLGFYNGLTAGNISILNDFATGNIIFSAGGSSTAHMTLHNTGNLLLGSTSNTGERLQVTGTGKFTGKIFANGSTSSVSGLEVGTLNFQYFATNNAFIAENAFYNGSAFQRVNTGSAAVFYLAGGGFQVGTLPSGTGGTTQAALNQRFFVTNEGKVSISDTISGGGNITQIASSVLQVDSTTKGFLPPRMTTTQKNAISSPAAGLVVYDTTLNKLCVYTTAWETITSV